MSQDLGPIYNSLGTLENKIDATFGTLASLAVLAERVTTLEVLLKNDRKYRFLYSQGNCTVGVNTDYPNTYGLDTGALVNILWYDFGLTKKYEAGNYSLKIKYFSMESGTISITLKLGQYLLGASASISNKINSATDFITGNGTVETAIVSLSSGYNVCGYLMDENTLLVGVIIYDIWLERKE